MGTAAKEQTQAIVKLGHGAKGGTHARHAGTLMQCERRRHVQHLVHLGVLGLRQTTAGIGAERLQIAARALGIKNPECQRTLARARHAGNTHEPSQRDINIDVLEVMDTCATHLDSTWLLRHRHHSPSARPRQSSRVKYVKYSVRTSPISSQGTSRST